MIARIRGFVRVETVLLALAVAVLIAITAFDRSAKETTLPIDSYSSYDAASGGYRAAYEVLGRIGVRVERFGRRPAFLDPALGTLVYAEPIDGDPRAKAVTKGDIAALEAWVRGGGHLLYIGYDDAAAKAGILALPRLADTRARAVATIAPELRALGIARIAALESQRFVVPRRGARGRARALVADARGALAVGYAFGRGDVIAVVDRSIFTNARIATGDRARLFVAFARPPRAAGVVAFDESVHGYATPERWWEIVPRPFAIALALALAALLVAIAGAALRLGPPLVPAPRDDRGTADFVDALAALYARSDDIRGTLVEAAASTSRTIARANGLDAAASKNEIAARIDRAELRASYVTLQNIVTNGFADRATLVRGVELARALRKEYATHGRSRN